MTEMTENKSDSRRRDDRLNEDKILYIAIGFPIAIALIVAGGPAIISGIKAVAGFIAPNVWVVLIYAYIALISFLIGRRSGRRR